MNVQLVNPKLVLDLISGDAMPTARGPQPPARASKPWLRLAGRLRRGPGGAPA
jgi:hypothetical protein